MFLLFISFIAGVLTVLAPCILPLLPVIVGRSLTDPTVSRRRAFVVILSLGLSVVVFTLILKVSTLFLNVPQSFWTWLSGGIIFVFGLIMIFPGIWESLPFTSAINRKGNEVMMEGYQKNNFWGDVLVGASLGPIFSACSPTYFVILATVLPVKPALGVVYLLVYALGLCLSLLVVVLAGQHLMKRLNLAADSHGWFKKIFGIIFILVALAIVTGFDKKLQISILNSGFFDVTKVEQKLLGSNESTTPASSTESADNTAPEDNSAAPAAPGNPVSATTPIPGEKFPTPAEKAAKYQPAPDIIDPTGFINTGGQPISISEFKGKKVVLVDIWTYSCINCLRTLPYVESWYDKYKDQGLQIIGLHDPEFSFEHVLANVEDAVARLGVKYPVVLDNDFATWKAFGNQYWPREYLIDMDGYIVHDHAGEGDYDDTEKAIQDALRELHARTGSAAPMPTGVVNPSGTIPVDFNKVGSPETYFGSERNVYLANGKQSKDGTQSLDVPASISGNSLYLGGQWNFVSEYAENDGGGEIVYKYNAKNVYMVASSDQGADVDVYLDGVFYKTIHIQDQKLYDIIDGADYGIHTLKIDIKSPGLKAYTFTFG